MSKKTNAVVVADDVPAVKVNNGNIQVIEPPATALLLTGTSRFLYDWSQAIYYQHQLWKHFAFLHQL